MANMRSHVELRLNCGDLVTMDDEQAIAKRIEEAGKRAAAEAEARRAKLDLETEPAAKEIGGRNGPDPTRYGDWEINGIACDF
jgi:hypothetical protein